MKKKTKFFVTICIFLTLLTTASIAAADTNIKLNTTSTPINLGKITYNQTIQKTHTVTFNNTTSQLQLTHIFTEKTPLPVKTVSTWFEGDKNQTTIVFQTKQLNFPWYFNKNQTCDTYYQGNLNDNIYILTMNYSQITLPVNPVKQVEKKYNSTITNLTQELNQTENNLTYFKQLYNSTNQTLNDTQNQLSSIWQNFNATSRENNNLTTKVSDLEVKYNNTRQKWLNASRNLSTMQNKYGNLITKVYGIDGLENGRGGIDGDLEDTKDELEDTQGSIPLYIIGFIVLTFVITASYFKRDWITGKKDQDLTKAERKTGYGTLKYAVDTIASGMKNIQNKFSNSEGKQNSKAEDKSSNNSYWFQKDTSEDIQNLQKEIYDVDGKIDQLKKQHVQDQQKNKEKIKDIEQKIDNIINTKK